MNPTRSRLALFLLLTRPWFLLGPTLLYALGLAVARYLGEILHVGLAVEGLLMVLALQLAVHYLNEYADAEADATNPNRTWFSGGSGALGAGGLPRSTALQAAIVSLTFLALLATTMLIRGETPVLAWAVFALTFPLAYFYSAPPLRLVASGYGEFIAALIVSALVPTFAYALQTGAMHRILFIATVPLVLFNFAMILAFEVPDYGTDLKFRKRTLMVRIGWDAGMRLHDVAVVAGCLALLLGILLDIPGRVTLGLLIVLPLAVAQVWQMGRIRRGARPNWRLLCGGAVALYALAAYLTFAGFAAS